jgi:hypothetical protein
MRAPGQRFAGTVVFALLIILMSSARTLAQTPQPMPPGPPPDPARPPLAPVDQANENFSLLRDSFQTH